MILLKFNHRKPFEACLGQQSQLYKKVCFGKLLKPHPEPVTDDDEFSECQNSMFIFQIPRLVRNWNFEQNNQTFQKMQTMVLLQTCFFIMLALRMDRKFFWFSPLLIHFSFVER